MYVLSTYNVEQLDSIVASDEVATFEVERLQNPLGSFRWRTSGVTASIVGKFAASTVVDTYGIMYCNARDSDTIRLRLADTEADLTSAPTLDTTPQPFVPTLDDVSGFDWTHCLRKVTETTSLWFRFDFDFTANTDGYVEIGVLAIGERWSPEIGQSQGVELQDEPRAIYTVDYAAGGQQTGGGTNKRNVAFILEGLTKDEMLGGLRPILRDRAGVGTVVVMLDEAEASYPLDYTYYGRIEERDATVVNPTQFSTELRIIEP